MDDEFAVVFVTGMCQKMKNPKCNSRCESSRDLFREPSEERVVKNVLCRPTNTIGNHLTQWRLVTAVNIASRDRNHRSDIAPAPSPSVPPGDTSMRGPRGMFSPSDKNVPVVEPSTGFREPTQRGPWWHKFFVQAEIWIFLYIINSTVVVTSAGHPACTQMGIVELAVVVIACTGPFVGCANEKKRGCEENARTPLSRFWKGRLVTRWKDEIGAMSRSCFEGRVAFVRGMSEMFKEAIRQKNAVEFAHADWQIHFPDVLAV
ncbi:hypothetical protein BDN67DRAFT_978787 [Paxillus ammoniavirescens]|nr:hypothetical protein BDN67DRAFT_978787 [Paxillus ammoniavirescens]